MVEKKKRINGRVKGATLERQVVNDLKPVFPFAKTANLASTLLDNCDVDIANVPYLIQCKSGLNAVNFRSKYEDMQRECRRLLKENFPPEDPLHSFPYIVIHKKTGIKGKKEPEMCQVTMDYETFLRLIKGDK